MKYRPHHIAISVRDLEKSVEFYSRLGYKQLYESGKDDQSSSTVHMLLGDSFLEIFAYAKNKNEAPLTYERANNPDEVGVKHVALQADDINAAFDDLKARNMLTEGTIVKESKIGIKYFFIQDPDGMWVEIVEDKR